MCKQPTVKTNLQAINQPLISCPERRRSKLRERYKLKPDAVRLGFCSYKTPAGAWFQWLAGLFLPSWTRCQGKRSKFPDVCGLWTVLHMWSGLWGWHLPKAFLMWSRHRHWHECVGSGKSFRAAESPNALWVRGTCNGSEVRSKVSIDHNHSHKNK